MCSNQYVGTRKNEVTYCYTSNPFSICETIGFCGTPSHKYPNME